MPGELLCCRFHEEFIIQLIVRFNSIVLRNIQEEPQLQFEIWLPVYYSHVITQAVIGNYSLNKYVLSIFVTLSKISFMIIFTAAIKL